MEFVDEAPAPAAPEDDGPRRLPDGFLQPTTLVATPAEAERILVLDVSNLAYRAHYAHGDKPGPGGTVHPGLRTRDGRRSGHVFGGVRMLVSALQRNLPHGRWCVAYCYDGEGAKEARRAILPTYKAGRSADFNPVPDVAEVLDDLPGLHVRRMEREGDDAIAWLADRVAGKGGGKPLYVWSGDFDLWALLRYPDLHIWCPNNTMQRLVTRDDVQAEYFVADPGRIYLAKALFGDHSDNVDGVFRLIRKSAAPLLNDPAVADVASLYEALPRHKFSPKTRAKILAHRPVVESNFRVVQPWTAGFTREAVRIRHVRPHAAEAFRANLDRYECARLVQYVHGLCGGGNL